MNNKYLIVVLGPTATGKTELGINLANYYKTDIVSADSRQIYKGLYIGTAQPTFSERQKAVHHLIDFVDLDSNYNVFDYETDSLNILNSLFKTKDVLILVGGSGLYINAVCNGLDVIPPVLDSVKQEVDYIYKNFGLDRCVDELLKLDITSRNYIDLKNPSRVIRALCVIKTTGKSIFTFFNKTKKDRNFNVIYIGLDFEKPVLIDRINRRVDIMINSGLVEEARSFIKYKEFNCLKTIGYKEIYDYFDGKISKLDDAIYNIKVNTKSFVKRQRTWFKKIKDVNWFYNPSFDDVLGVINKRINL